MAVERKENWPRHLNEWIRSQMLEPFEYGSHDCCTFAAGAVEAITGVDLMVEFRGQYDSEAGSVEALATLGQGTLYRTLRRKLGNPVKGIEGRRGDVAYHAGCCGVVLGRQAIFLDADEGAILVPIRELQRAFRVG